MNSFKSIVSSYGGHLAGYIVSAAGIVAGLNPKLMPPQYAWLTSVAGLVAIAAHNSYKSGQVSGAVQAAATAATDALKNVPPAAVGALVLMLGAFGLGGCATVEGFFASPASAPVVESVVLVAVGTAESKGVQAADINRIAKLALAADSGAGATLATVAGAVNVELAKLNLPAADLAAANILEAALSAVIQERIGQNPDVATTQANIATVLGYAIAATGG